MGACGTIFLGHCGNIKELEDAPELISISKCIKPGIRGRHQLRPQSPIIARDSDEMRMGDVEKFSLNYRARWAGIGMGLRAFAIKIPKMRVPTKPIFRLLLLLGLFCDSLTEAVVPVVFRYSGSAPPVLLIQM